MFQLGPGELVVILLLALIIFGPGKLPEVGRALGKTVSEFRRATRQIEDDVSVEPRRIEPASAAGSSPASGSQAASTRSNGGQAGPVT